MCPKDMTVALDQLVGSSDVYAIGCALDKGIDVNLVKRKEAWLVVAVRLGRDKVAKELIACSKININADVYVDTLFYNEDYYDNYYTPLMLAVALDNDEIVDALLKHETINVNYRMNSDNRPWYDGPVVGRHFPYLDHRGAYGQTALTIALKRQNKGIAKQLLFAGAEIDVHWRLLSLQEKACFISAVEEGVKECLEALAKATLDEKAYQTIINKANRMTGHLQFQQDFFKDYRASRRDYFFKLIKEAHAKEPNAQRHYLDKLIYIRDHLGLIQANEEEKKSKKEKTVMTNFKKLIDDYAKKFPDAIEAVVLTQEQKNVQLIEAAKSGDLDALERAIASGAEVNAKNKEDNSALIRAAWRGHQHVVERLLRCPGIDVNQVNDVGNSPLILAIGAGHMAVFKMLLAHPDININYVSDHSPNYKYSALIVAVTHGRTEMAKKLLNREEIEVNSVDYNSETALMRAVKTQQFFVIKEILARPDVDIHHRALNNQTALTLAAVYGTPEIVEKLLAYPGANAEHLEKERCAALDYALKADYVNTANTLLGWEKLFDLNLDAEQAAQLLDKINQRIEFVKSDKDFRKTIREMFVDLVVKQLNSEPNNEQEEFLKNFSKRITLIKDNLAIIQPNEKEQSQKKEKTAMQVLGQLEYQTQVRLNELSYALSPVVSAEAILKSGNLNSEALDDHINNLLNIEMHKEGRFQSQLLTFLKTLKRADLDTLKNNLVDIALASNKLKNRPQVQAKLKRLLSDIDRPYDQSPFLFILRTGQDTFDQKNTKRFSTLKNKLVGKKGWPLSKSQQLTSDAKDSAKMKVSGGITNDKL